MMDEQNKKDALGGNREQAFRMQNTGDRRQKSGFSYAPAATRFFTSVRYSNAPA